MVSDSASKTRNEVLKETWGMAIHKLISKVCQELRLPKPNVVCDAKEQHEPFLDELDCWWSFEFPKAVLSVVVWVPPMTDANTVHPEILVAEFSVRSPGEFMSKENTVGCAMGIGTFPNNRKSIIAELKRLCA